MTPKTRQMKTVDLYKDAMITIFSHVDHFSGWKVKFGVLWAITTALALYPPVRKQDPGVVRQVNPFTL